MNTNTISKQSLNIGKKCSDVLEIHKQNIDILCRLAGYRLSDMYVDILAHCSYYGHLEKDLKTKLSEKYKTSTQVISNGITKLRKLGLINKNVIADKLNVKNKNKLNINFYVQTQN